MGIDISVLMGANIANEVAAEKFCETTIGKLQMAILVYTFTLKDLCSVECGEQSIPIVLQAHSNAQLWG